MKQIFLALTVATLLALGANNAHAQLALNLEVPTEVKATTNTEALVNVKALQSFQKYYANASGVSWTALKDGYVATFKNNGITTQTGFNRKGKMNYEILRYNASNLPDQIKNQVTGTYEDYDITGVDEVHADYHVAYFVHLEGKKFFKIVCVNDEGMSVYQDIQKSM